MTQKLRKLKPAKVPCKSCPYRLDVPAGIWAESEYAKLVEYDAPTWAQPPLLFMCHNSPDDLCAGWVGCHNKAPRGQELLALRFVRRVDPLTHDYVSPVPLFASGREAAEHGMSGIEMPDEKALRMVKRLEPKIAKRSKL